jgi:hypothetical protein
MNIVISGDFTKLSINGTEIVSGLARIPPYDAFFKIVDNKMFIDGIYICEVPEGLFKEEHKEETPSLHVSAVKYLREQTGFGLFECKLALEDTINKMKSKIKQARLSSELDLTDPSLTFTYVGSDVEFVPKEKIKPYTPNELGPTEFFIHCSKCNKSTKMEPDSDITICECGATRIKK